MSTQKDLNSTLNEIISEIGSGLSWKLRVLFDKTSDEVKKTNGLSSLIKRRDRLKDKLESVRAELRQTKDEIRETDGRSSMDEVGDDEVMLLNYCNVSNYDITKSKATAIKNIMHTPEAKNLINWNKVKENTMRVYNLAVTLKEKRSVILSLQSRDWRSLGIELPSLPHFEKFDIADGVIKVPSLKMLETK